MRPHQRHSRSSTTLIEDGVITTPAKVAAYVISWQQKKLPEFHFDMPQTAYGYLNLFAGHKFFKTLKGLCGHTVEFKYLVKFIFKVCILLRVYIYYAQTFSINASLVL
jgi:hypothetical protein